MSNDAMTARTITIRGHNKQEVEAYIAQPVDRGPSAGILVFHHMPGYDRETKEVCRTFATRGYTALMPNLFHRYAPGAKWPDAAAAAREAGGVPDEQAMGDGYGAIVHLRSLADHNGKIGVIGYCSGGRQTYLAACTFDVDAAVDCYGGGVVIDSPEQLTPQRPVAPLDKTADLSCPVLGLFGDQDHSPTPAHVAKLEAALKEHGKDYDFHMYEGAGHGFFSVDYPNYHREASRQGWREIWRFFEKELSA
ncbi:MAG: dienelactone hydrolase family protein [Actinomycetota bacterium]